jgi:uncharacterized transporter YbjL
MTFIGWLFIVGGLASLVVDALAGSAGAYLGGIYWTLVGLAFIIAGVGYNIQTEIRRKNQQPETPPLKVSQMSGTLTNPDDHKLREIPTPRSHSVYDKKPD